MSAATLLEAPKEKAIVNASLWKSSLFSLIPWAIKARDKIQLPTIINKELKKHAISHENLESTTLQQSGIRFRPYVSKVPWHTGPRGFLSQLFPRYGNYCGPNWSSGKDRGSPIWDKRPIDWLDFCCYCHDIGYDTHNQAELLKADLAFLECLERPNMKTKGDPRVANLYKFMCISGLRNMLIPYRQNLLKLQSRKLFFPLMQFSNMKWRGWNFAKT
ncbi:uncharacterized protein LOC127259181 [Andrographis paniculata]|uniref:uncharacterized protein LOC127259181 n=1 Tax=Andrographis paniculata TaxID=175694 RepID=UPI0021E879E6|nr:uncharacterized protein LOC127259181 [Andrographis paniculata]XP_051142300.1 uncharacterized protein LOC127259181 [Andrographis paniculata]